MSNTLETLWGKDVGAWVIWFEEDPYNVLTATDLWMAMACNLGYGLDAKISEPEPYFGILARALQSWARHRKLAGPEANTLFDFVRYCRATHKPGPPNGSAKTPEEIEQVMCDAKWVIDSINDHACVQLVKAGHPVKEPPKAVVVPPDIRDLSPGMQATLKALPPDNPDNQTYKMAKVIGNEISVEEGTVRKQVMALRSLGFDIVQVPRQGYYLRHASGNVT